MWSQHPAWKRWVIGAAVLALLFGRAAWSSADSAVAQIGVRTDAAPSVVIWEAQMIQYGLRHLAWWGGEGMLASPDERLDHTYYDELRVLYQVAAYTGQPVDPIALAGVLNAYRDEYVLAQPVPGTVTGWWNFTTGLRMHFEATGDQQSKAAVIAVRDNAAFSNPDTPVEWIQSANLMREVAYAILAHIDAEALGAAPSPYRAVLVDAAYDHLVQIVEEWWRDNPANFDPDSSEEDRDQSSPFMVGLVAHSLIRDWEETQDPRLLPALRRVADYLWSTALAPTGDAMVYDIVTADWEGGRDPAYDLNLLIAPMYAFLFTHTGETAYRDRADILFAAGVTNAFLTESKQFHQNYWWSFDYVRWRAP